MQPAATLLILRREERYFFHLTQPIANARVPGSYLRSPTGVFDSMEFKGSLRTQIENATEDAAEGMLALKAGETGSAARSRRSTQASGQPAA